MRAFVYTRASVCMRVYECMCVYLYARARRYVGTFLCARVLVHACVFVCMTGCVHVCVRACVRVCCEHNALSS